MVAFPNGKINLGLHITGKRKDNFHNIETVFYPVAINDAVEIIEADVLSFSTTGFNVSGPTDNNLCLRAYQLLKADYASLPPVSIHLHKNIPVGAGLGGGSADAVVCLQVLDKIAGLKLTQAQFSAYALQLGSDCPFFLVNKTSVAAGRGEELTEINLDLSQFKLLLVNPRIHINTGWAFSSLETFSQTSELAWLAHTPIQEWKERLHNDFEQVVFKKYPDIKTLKDLFYEKGALYASMSGTGSTVYGFFEKNKIPDLQLPPSYFIKWL